MNPDILAILESIQIFMDYLAQDGGNLSQDAQRQLMSFIQESIAFVQEYQGQQTQVSIAPPPAPIDQIEQGPPSADAQLLWILAGQQEDYFIQYLQNYPSPATQNLLNNPSELERTIKFLHQMMPSGSPPVINGIRHTDINSSVVWGTNYNPKTGQMRVRFQNGSVYEYDGVPQNIYKAFASGAASAKTDGQNRFGRWWVNKNPSVGAALNQYIKANNFTYRKLQ